MSSPYIVFIFNSCMTNLVNKGIPINKNIKVEKKKYTIQTCIYILVYCNNYSNKTFHSKKV